ncbi:ABC transporter [miscellaneous Crenarchaeota group-1 archaeon SG8-32-1]|uniref:ABC transporter n=1 Tax=miscellaneous Crenarchaeota group-1 archaeon SG8-32-1 TaxID=1685124 RepID=A0A0M0C081_9ARCH|nr:MAG: ABC transporter [miscellaneous Crenarchaeota group-1 archaeon SG8-32-1]
MTEILVKAENLTKKFGALIAVDNINFEIFKGESFGFLGPNGAGKTTTMRMIQSVSPLTEGKLTLAGMNVKDNSREIKCMIGVAPQEDNLDPDFTVFQNLIAYSRYFDVPKEKAKNKAEELLNFLQLEEKRDVIITSLSGGMRRRLILARALMNEPQILILDEPTTGLDPQARHLIWTKIRSLKNQGVTVILTTHYMDEAAQLCDRITIMDNGKIIEKGKPSDMVKKHVGEEVLEVIYSKESMDCLKNTFPEARIDVVDEKIHVFTQKPRGILAKVLEETSFKGAAIRDSNLEDVFLKLAGRSLKD